MVCLCSCVVVLVVWFDYVVLEGLMVGVFVVCDVNDGVDV